jgi:predicted  nucleic acid-binding Zn-ribbon protein
MVPCTIDANGTLLTLEFTPPAGVAVAKVHFKDKNGLGNSDKIEFNIFPDPAPTVHIKKPAWTVERILPDAQVTLEIAAADKTFALRSVYLEYRRKNSNGDFVGPATRVPIVHAQLSAAMVMLGQNYQGMALPAHIRPTFLELIFPWQLRGQFKEGEIVSIQVCADDFNNSIGASRTIDIVIASQRQFFEQVDAELEKLQKKVVNVLQDQEDSLKIVKDVQNAKNMDPRERRDKLDEAREKQKSIKNTIGAGPEEGMRREVDALKEKLAENKLPPSALQDNVNSLSKELDRISRDDLPQIEDLLAKSSRETAKVEPKPDVQPEPKPKTKPDGKPETKIEPKKKDSLEQARGFQEDAKKTLADLARTLEPWANQQQIKERLAKLVVEQKNLRRDTENLGAEGDKKPGKADLDPRADRQDDLAVQTEDLLRTIKEVKEKQKGTDVGDKLTAVDQIADEAKIPETMREVSGRLRKTEEPNLVDSVQKQDDIIKSLEKMLAALEEKDPAEQLDRLTRKQKKAQQEINDLQIKMNELDKKIDDARNNPDPMQRADMLKALAPEQQKLEEKARELSRELSRLHAEKASRDLERAAQEMADAKKKLDEGEDPMGDQQKAKKDLDRAKADLEQVRQELDRESLARIADKLKGIKERQDAFVADTERIFKTVEDMNKWTTGTQKSLKQSADVQTGLAKETDSFKEKLAQYPVFEHILKKAKSSMDKAADAVLKPSPDRGLAGEPLDEVNLAATKNDRDRIVKLEKEASERLDWLVEAIKEDLKDKEVKAAAPKKGEGEKQPNGDDPAANKANPNGTQGDGIPPAAELKLMIRDQEDIRNKTKAFDERFPNRDDLTEEQRAELRALEAEQAAIGELFERITNRNKEKGEEQ